MTCLTSVVSAVVMTSSVLLLVVAVVDSSATCVECASEDVCWGDFELCMAAACDGCTAVSSLGSGVVTDSYCWEGDCACEACPDVMYIASLGSADSYAYSMTDLGC